ncbi:hypothetical protein GOBAR_DD25471 [Gossypium barbadense]|nr:hypothetical protein GOBAR_DD25471 [Gossypium barbadense]
MSRGAEVSSYHALDMLDLQSDLLVYIRIRFILDLIKGYSAFNILNWSTAAANKLEQAGFQNIAGELASSMFFVFLSKDDEDDSVAKMKAAEEALEAKQKIFMQNYPMILLYLYCMAAPCIS